MFFYPVFIFLIIVTLFGYISSEDALKQEGPTEFPIGPLVFDRARVADLY